MPVNMPKRAFFAFSFACPYRADPPVIDGLLKDWDDRFRLPDLGVLEGEGAYAEVYMAWHETGLYLALQVSRPAALAVDPRRPVRGDGLQVWIDTRDVREAHRASRYCHHFWFLPRGGGKSGKDPLAGQNRVRRARAQAKMCDPADLGVASRVLKTGYRMEVHLPAAALTGFDHEENSRLGFSYLLKDRKLGRQSWTADEPLPVSYDPSLWGALELIR
ncbi:MAG: sugar-binding protein [Candidatus Latescibacteria bacterium]|jgi:hypothetical protein|nr:sugar-binding protein [Candidatus Latescibacterota bacterium]